MDKELRLGVSQVRVKTSFVLCLVVDFLFIKPVLTDNGDAYLLGLTCACAFNYG